MPSSFDLILKNGKCFIDGQLKIIGVSRDPENNEIGSANVNFVVTINEHFLKQEAGV